MRTGGHDEANQSLFAILRTSLKKSVDYLSLSLTPWALPVNTEWDVMSRKSQLPTNDNYKYYNAHNCKKTSILQTEKPCFSYYGIRFLYKITDGERAEGNESLNTARTAVLGFFREGVPTLQITITLTLYRQLAGIT
jgi:hypothetical protein